MASQPMGLHTLCIHGGEVADPTTGAVAPPIHQSTTFAFQNAEEAAATFSGKRPGYVYTRWGNPTLAMLEQKIVALERGEAALVTASGMAAVATAVLTVVRAGDHIVSARSIYSGSYELFMERLPSCGIEVTLVDASDPQNIASALRPNTRLIYLESPGNPTLQLIDLAAAVQIARDAGLVTMADNTFATPMNQRPLELGVDLVVHSATKYLCGHGDAIGGAIVGSRDWLEPRARNVLRDFGGILSPFNAWLIARGIATLPLRVARHNENAFAVASFLETHPRVAWVSYPGLPSHPQHELARRQMQGYGGMVCFEVKGGVSAGERLMDRVELCTLAVSLGDTRTLICHSASTTHSMVPRETRLAMGITDGLVRMSVGLEDVEDIIADLDRALG